MDGEKGFELWVPQTVLLSKICGQDVAHVPFIGSSDGPGCENPFDLLFFNTSDTGNEFSLSFSVYTLFRQFPNFKNNSSSILSEDESKKIESFRESFLSLLNQGRGTGVSDKLAFLNVAFLHFGGKLNRGYMHKSEFKDLTATYSGIFENQQVEDMVFNCLDRENAGMISRLDFIAGFISCSPEVNDSLKSYEGKLRFQHIFWAYDKNRDGSLDKMELKQLISDIYKNGEFENTQQSIDRDVEALASRFNPFTYDVFFKCVEMGAIQHIGKLFHASFDLSEKVKEHLVFALANVQILSTVEPIREPLWSKGVEKMSAVDINSCFAYNTENVGISGINYQITNRNAGIYGQSSDRSGMSSYRSEGIDIYANINNFYQLQQKDDFTSLPYKIERFGLPQIKTFDFSKHLNKSHSAHTATHVSNNLQGINSNLATSPSKTDAIEAELNAQKNEKKIALELDYRINSLITDYFKRFLGHHSSIIDQKIATSVFVQMYSTFFGLEPEKIESKLIPFRWCNCNNFLVLCNNFSDLARKEDKIVKIKSPVHIIGDLGGNFVDLIRIFNLYGWPLHSRTSNGDSTILPHFIIKICDRISPLNTVSSQSLECLLIAMSLKVLFPKHITIIGSYEKSQNAIQAYNSQLYNEILDKLKKFHDKLVVQNDNALINQCAKEMLKSIYDVFDDMPKGVLVDHSILIKGVTVDDYSIFSKYSACKYPLRLKIIPYASKEQNLGVETSLYDKIANLSNPNCGINDVIELTNDSKNKTGAASLFVAKDKIVYNPLEPLQ